MLVERKGATRRSAIAADVLRGLNEGTCESATLAEGLAVDFVRLLRCVAPDLTSEAVARLNPADGITTRMRTVGTILAESCGVGGLATFAGHRSDTVRGWAAHLIAAVPRLTLRRRLDLVRPLADDAHFGVREWAWIALRPAVAADSEAAIKLLAKWSLHDSANVRRYASEITRPRGVWCAHVAELKDDPSRGLAVLEPLRSDPSRYVQDSVANWLNDAGKSRPEWVQLTCRRWAAESPTAETARICRRATRNLAPEVP